MLDHVRIGQLAPAPCRKCLKLLIFSMNILLIECFYLPRPPWRKKKLGLRVYNVSRHFLQHTRRRHHNCWHLLQVSFPPYWTSSNTAYMSDCHTVTLPLLLTNTEPQCSKYAITLRGLVFTAQPHCGQQRSSPGDNDFKIITTDHRSGSGHRPTEWTQFEGNQTWQKDFSCRYLKYFCIQNIWAPGSTLHRIYCRQPGVT